MTQRIHLSRLALLNLVMVCGNLSGNVSSLRLKRADFRPLLQGMNNFRSGSSGPEAPVPAAALCRGAAANLARRFHDLRALCMTRNERRRVARVILQCNCRRCLRSGRTSYLLEAEPRPRFQPRSFGVSLLPHQDIRSLSSHTRFSPPRGISSKKQIRRVLTRTRRFRHGIARAIEGLRGVRLSLVPCPDPGECVLQRM